MEETTNTQEVENSVSVPSLSVLPSHTPTILEKGKIPPQDIALEEAVIGGMLIDKKGVDDVIDILSKDIFYQPSHQLIYEAIYELFQNTQPIDLFTVIEQLRKNGNLKKVGGEASLVLLTQKVSSAAHIEFHARILLQKYIQRSLIKMSNEIIEEAYQETTDVFSLLDSAEGKLFNITQGNINKSSESAKDLVIKARQKIQEISNRKEDFSGIPTGFTKVDEVTAGWQATDLIIVAARPAMGKTAFTLTMARNIAVDKGIPVAFFSLEMGSVQLITRLISAETGIDSDTLRKGKLTEEQWYRLNTQIQGLEDAPLYIDDTPSLSIFDLRAKARRMVAQYGIKIIFIDYLQLMTANSGGKGVGNREQEISTISRNLKALAKELDLPVIALSQLSRNVESRVNQGHKRPQLSDLRESGAIEQDADIVTFLYRPEYYGITNWDDGEGGEGSPTTNEAEFIIAKHRNGGLDNIKLKFKNGVFSNRDVSFMMDNEVQSFESKRNYEDFINSPVPKMEISQAFDDVAQDKDEDNNDIPY
ncbi:MAG: replicative DNA helicase [Capnocytophaga sp.]|nr:replicative DNA helicase [Capnocytophaga sp.]